MTHRGYRYHLKIACQWASNQRLSLHLVPPLSSAGHTNICSLLSPPLCSITLDLWTAVLLPLTAVAEHALGGDGCVCVCVCVTSTICRSDSAALHLNEANRSSCRHSLANLRPVHIVHCHQFQVFFLSFGSLSPSVSVCSYHEATEENPTYRWVNSTHSHDFRPMIVCSVSFFLNGRFTFLRLRVCRSPVTHLSVFCTFPS